MKVGLNKLSQVEAEALSFAMGLFENVSLKKGDRVKKVHGEEGDVHNVGVEGTVVGGMNVDGHECYLVEFDEHVGTPTFIVGNKLQLI